MADKKTYTSEDISTLLNNLIDPKSFGYSLSKTVDRSYDRALLDKEKGIEISDEHLEKLLSKKMSQEKSIDIVNSIANTIENTSNILLTYRNKEIQLIQNGIALLDKTLGQQLSLSSQSITDSLNVISQVYAGNVKNIGKTALQNEMNLMKQSLKFENTLSYSLLEWQNQYKNTQWNFWTDQANNLNDLGHDFYNDYNRLFKETVFPENSTLQAQYNARQDEIAQLEQTSEGLADFAKQIVGVGKAANEKWFNPMRDFTAAQQKAINDYTEQILEQLQNTFQPLTELVDQVKQSLFELDKQSKRTALSFGYIGNKGQQYTQKILDENANIAALWGKEFKDLLENQEKYLDNADRNYMFSAKDQDMTFAAARLFGMENSGEMATLFGEMNIFNTSIEKGADTMREMYDIANNMGVSNKKFVKDLSSNLKLAQKYNFVGGTKAMEKMSLWAQQVRLNLNSAAQFAEKLIGGGIEDTLTTAANLQVLGGNAAIFSDPLGMMYDAGADMESMAHRIEAMVGNFGTLDRKTGETKFSWTDTKMMNEIAKALGMSREEVMNMNREKNKFSVVSRQMLNTGLTEEQKRMVSNRAVYDEATGKFKVNTLTHGEQTVDQLTPELLKDILPEDNQEALVEYARRSLDVETELLAIARQTTGLAMVGSANAWYEAQQKMLQETINVQDRMVRLSDNYSSQIWGMEVTATKNNYNRAITAADQGLFNQYIEYFNQNNENIDNLIQSLNNDFNILSGALSGNTLALGLILEKMAVMTGDDDLLNTAKTLLEAEAYSNEHGQNLWTKLGGHVMFGSNSNATSYGNSTQFVQNNPDRGSVYPTHQFKLESNISNGDVIGSNITPIGKVNDAEIRNPVMASIDNADRLYAAKSGGALDKSLEIIAAMVSHISNQIKNGIDTNTNLNVNGNLNVQGNNIDINKLIKAIGNDTEASYELLKLINNTMSKQENLKVRSSRIL